ncbi:MAG: hypothetical protein ACOCXX_05335 [Planctomycetota bacterium]
MNATFNGTSLGHEVVDYRLGYRRLATDQHAAVWQHAAVIDDASPGWLTRIELVLRLAADDLHGLNRAINTLATSLTSAGMATLVLLNGSPAATVVECESCRFDALEPIGTGLAEPGKQRQLVRLVFTSSLMPDYAEA